MSCDQPELLSQLSTVKMDCSQNYNFYNIQKKMKLIHLVIPATAASSVMVDHPSMRGGFVSWNHRELEEYPELPKCYPQSISCWCDNGGTDTCPEFPQESIYIYRPEISDFFAELSLDKPNYDGLELCHPDLTSSKNLAEISIGDPYILFSEGILDENEVEMCNEDDEEDGGSSNDEDDEVCGIKFKFNGQPIDPNYYNDECDAPTLANSYEVKTIKNAVESGKKGYFLLHEGREYFVFRDSALHQKV